MEPFDSSDEGVMEDETSAATTRSADYRTHPHF